MTHNNFKHIVVHIIRIFSGLSLLMIGNVSADVYSAIESKLKYNSNLTNASLSQNIVDDGLVAVSGIVGNHFQLDDKNSLSLQAQFDGEAYKKYQDMDNVSLAGKLILSRKWDLGLYAPWTSLAFSGAYLKNSNQVRDGARYQVQLSGGKRLAERWSIWSDFQFEKRTAANNLVIHEGVSGAVFDQTSESMKLNAMYNFNSTIYMKLGYGLRYGDVASTSIEETPGSNIDSVMTAVSWDPTFGPNAEVYRITAITHTLGASVSKTLTPHLILSLEYQYLMTYAKGNNNYYVSLPALTLDYNF